MLYQGEQNKEGVVPHSLPETNDSDDDDDDDDDDMEEEKEVSQRQTEYNRVPLIKDSL